VLRQWSLHLDNYVIEIVGHCLHLQYYPYASNVGEQPGQEAYISGTVNTTIAALLPVGQDRYRTLTRRYYENTDAVMVVYSSVEEESFREIQDYWFQELQHYLKYDDESVPILLVANKSDLISPDVDTVHFGTAKELALQKGLLHPIECSAKTGHNVKQAFHVIATALFKKSQPSRKPNVSSVTRRQCSCMNRSSDQKSERLHVDNN
uniref:Small monomeric GTPase n=1 Tax=Amphimedon queenslandica TaxID=400682 RepID=A0A1X7U0F0_AMPQE